MDPHTILLCAASFLSVPWLAYASSTTLVFASTEQVNEAIGDIVRLPTEDHRDKLHNLKEREAIDKLTYHI